LEHYLIMPITLNGSGTVTGISAGGLPDASILTADIADANITAAKLSGAQTGTAPVYGCRAWVNFDGTGTTGTNMTIRGSGNVASVLKNGTGDYTITFTTAMPDANFSVSGNAEWNPGVNALSALTVRTYTSSSIRIDTANSADGTKQNPIYVNVAIFR
jgi:hypothetical protein